jgi:hypothetical protein
MTPRLALIVCLSVSATQTAVAEPSRVTLLADAALSRRLSEPMRTESAVRGLQLESIPAVGAGPSLARALAQRSGVAGVVWIGDAPSGANRAVWAMSGDGATRYAILPGAEATLDGRLFATIAFSVLDELTPPSDVDVEVSVTIATPAKPPAAAEPASAPPAPPSAAPVVANLAPSIAAGDDATSSWFLDLGGLYAGVATAAHLGIGQYLSSRSQLGVFAHYAWIGRGDSAAALSLEYARTPSQLRWLELGARAMTARVRDGTEMCATWCSAANVQYGVGAGGFAGLRLPTRWGVLGVRAGFDAMAFRNRAGELRFDDSVVPSGAVHWETALW